MTMRTMWLLMLALGTALSTCGAQATYGAASIDSFARVEKYRTTDMEIPCRRYLACLRADNDGVVESALGLVARIKLYTPSLEMNELMEVVSRLGAEGRTPSIRYRAYLVSMLLAKPEWFTMEGTRDYPHDQDLYFALSGRIAKTLLNPSTRPLARADSY
jgi:hypothetical protein